jgi:MFS family permease
MHTLRAVLSLVGCSIYMLFLGTPYVIGNITPYLSSYFRVSPSETQLILPTLIFLQTLVMPIGGQLASRLPAKLLMLIGTITILSCLLACSLLDRDQFYLFKYLYSGGYAFAVGLTYMVPVQIGW